MQVDRPPAELGAAAVHDVRGSVGSIRLAVTSVMADDGEDADFRAVMLSTIEEETRRLDAALGGLQALIAALTDQEPAKRVDLDVELDGAAAEAARRQISAPVSGAEGLAAMARPSFRAVVAALFGIASDGGSPVAVTARSLDDGVSFRIGRVDGAAVRSDRALVEALLEAMGAERRASADAIEFWLPDANAG